MKTLRAVWVQEQQQAWNNGGQMFEAASLPNQNSMSLSAMNYSAFTKRNWSKNWFWKSCITRNISASNRQHKSSIYVDTESTFTSHSKRLLLNISANMHVSIYVSKSCSYLQRSMKITPGEVYFLWDPLPHPSWPDTWKCGLTHDLVQPSEDKKNVMVRLP